MAEYTFRRIRIVVLRMLGVRCGAYGGENADHATRWCLKRFGHSDSCVFDWTAQPGTQDRQQAKGWGRMKDVSNGR